MGAKTEIAWTNATWSPLRVRVKQNATEIARDKGYTSLVQIAEKMAGRVGPHCERVSDGCSNCYAESNNHRCLPSNGTGLPYDRRSRDLVEPFVDEKILAEPLKWRTPKRIFVENQSDLFGEWVPDEMIDQVFAVMALCPQHVWQVLTKRPKRMAKYYAKPQGFGFTWREGYIQNAIYAINKAQHFALTRWPLPNLWLGVSVEDQKTADERIPALLQTPAAVRFVSYEPALAAVDLAPYLQPMWNTVTGAQPGPWLDWMIVGGESGPGARPFDIQWARNTVQQCRDAEVSCFVKQLGSWPFDSGLRLPLDKPLGIPQIESRVKFKSRKGADWSEWADDLKVRQFPNASH